jgi:hypothetical protein
VQVSHEGRMERLKNPDAMDWRVEVAS